MAGNAMTSPLQRLKELEQKAVGFERDAIDDWTDAEWIYLCALIKVLPAMIRVCEAAEEYQSLSYKHGYYSRQAQQAYGELAEALSDLEQDDNEVAHEP